MGVTERAGCKCRRIGRWYGPLWIPVIHEGDTARQRIPTLGGESVKTILLGAAIALSAWVIFVVFAIVMLQVKG